MQESLDRAMLQNALVAQELANPTPVFMLDSEEAKRKRDGVVYEKMDYRNTGKSKAVLKRRKRNKNKKTHR